MPIAYHIVLGAYGFWLPNDPRGSWSRVVASSELLQYGPATKVTTLQSVAHRPLDPAWKQHAQTALKHEPAVFDAPQILAIGHGFGNAITEGKYVCFACAILPEHVHVVIGRHARSVGQIVGHLKSAATRSLRTMRPWPADRPVWAENCWKVFLDNAADVQRSVAYTNENVVRAGKPPQDWPFVSDWR